MASPCGEHRKLTTSPISDGGMSRPVVALALSSVAALNFSPFSMEFSVPPARATSPPLHKFGRQHDLDTKLLSTWLRSLLLQRAGETYSQKHQDMVQLTSKHKARDDSIAVDAFLSIQPGSNPHKQLHPSLPLQKVNVLHQTASQHMIACFCACIGACVIQQHRGRASQTVLQQARPCSYVAPDNVLAPAGTRSSFHT